MKKPVIVSSSKVGLNCWKAARFTSGECPRVETCKYPEKNTCKAYLDKVRIVRIPYRVLAKDTR